MQKCCHEQKCSLKRGLGKEDSGGRTKKTRESFKLSEKDSGKEEKMAERNKGNGEQINCAQDVTKSKSKVTVAWGEMQGEH